MKKKIQKIGSAILCMTLLGNAIAGSIPNGKVQAAQQYKEVYCDDFENGEIYATHASTEMTSSNVLEEKTNHYFKFKVTGYVSLKTAAIEVEGGKTYRLSYRIHVPEVSDAVHIRPTYQEWEEATNNWSNVIDKDTPDSCKIETTTDGWQSHTMTFTPSIKKDHVLVFFEQAWGGSAEVWLDDIMVCAVETDEVVYSEDFSQTQQLAIQDKGEDVLLERSRETEILHAYALKMSGAKNGYTVKTPGFSVVGGEKYKLSYKLKVSNLSGDNCFYPWFQEWYVKDGVEAGWNSVYSQTPENNKWKEKTDGWVQEEIEYTPSKEMTHMQFFFEKAWGGSADVELDDIVVTNVNDGTVVYEQNFNTKNKLNAHSVTDSEGSQDFTAQGNHSLQLNGKGEVQTPIIRLENGKKYVLSYRVKIENVSGILDFKPTYQEWYNGTYDGDYLPNANTPNDYVRQANTDGWEEIRMPFSLTDHRNMVQFFFVQWAEGSADIYIDDVKILEVVDTSRKVNTNISFSNIGASQEWYFKASNISDLTAQFYVTTMNVDGTQRRVNVEKNGTNLVVWTNFFDGEIAPKTELAIPAGTILSQVDMSSNRWNSVEGGEKVTITNDLKVAYVDSAWQEYDSKSEKTRYVNLDVQGSGESISGTEYTAPGTHVEKYIQTKMKGQTSETVATVEDGNIATTMSWKSATGEEWYFTIQEAVTTTGLYKIPATVDGENTYVVMSLVSDQNFGTIYAQPGWFGIYGSHIPTKSMKFEAGAVAKQVDADKGFAEIEGASSLQLTKDCELQIEKTLVQRVSALYKTGDVHLDDAYNSMDLVAMKKIASDTTEKTTDLAENRAADVNGSGTVDKTDLAALRGHLVGKTDIRYDSKINAMYNGVMPIIGYDGPDYDGAEIDGEGRGASGEEPNMITEEVYSMVEDMGFNTVVANRNEIGTSNDIAFSTLELAEKHGLKAYLYNGYISDHTLGDAQATTKDEFEAINQKYEQYESFLGYYIGDEPKKAAIKNYATPLNLLKNYTNLSGYMNLYPCNSSTLKTELISSNITTGMLSEDTYKGYLKEANNQGTDFLSYDMYLRDNSYKNKKQVFYTNLKWSSDVAKEVGKPFYAFVQVGTDFEENQTSATAQSNLTTVQEMYLEANAALAMGAKGLNYYSLMQPIKFARWSTSGFVGIGADSGYDLYRCGLINIKGKPNHGAGGDDYDYYAAAKKINTYIAKIDEVLMHADHKAVIATEDKVKEYVDGVASYGSLVSVTCTDSILVGCYDYYGREAYLVVSTSCDAGGVGKSQSVTLNFNTDTSYSYVGMDCVDYEGSGTLNLQNLGSGEAVLVVMDE